VINVCAFPRAHSGTRRNAHATTIGKLKKVDPNAHDMRNKPRKKLEKKIIDFGQHFNVKLVVNLCDAQKNY
jgi:hypothetical protein